MLPNTAFATPFSQQQQHHHQADRRGGGGGGGPRVSPFQQAALQQDILAVARIEQDAAARLRSLLPPEPLDAGARQGDGRARHQDQGQQQASPSPHPGSGGTLRIVMMAADGGSGRAASPTVLVRRAGSPLRVRSVLRSVSANGSSAPGLPQLPGHSRLRSTSIGGASSSSSRSSGDGDGSGGGGDGSSTMRRLQRRSSSLLAATSATATQVWSSITDRSRLLLCMSSSVSSEDITSSSSSSNSRVRSTRRSSSLDGPGPAPAVSLSLEPRPGMAASRSGISAGRVPRLSARLLTRSTSIHRSFARSAAMLADLEPSDSYDDLLALDQFAVRRAVRAPVLQALPARSPCADDAAQQRQCLVCFEAWAPAAPQQHQHHAPQLQNEEQEQRRRRQESKGEEEEAHKQAAGEGRAVCRTCGRPTSAQGGHQQQQQQQQRQRPSPWATATLSRQALVPAPASAQLDDSDADIARASSSGSSSEYASASSRASADAFVDALEAAVRGGQGAEQAASGGARPPSFDAWVRAGTAAAVLAGRGAPGGGSWQDATPLEQAQADLAGEAAAGGPCQCGPLAQQRWQPGPQPACGGSQQGQHALPEVVIRKLPCGHEFCCGCIRTWLKDHVSCPVCRWTFPESDTRLINMNK